MSDRYRLLMQWMDRFLYSPRYLITLSVLTVLSNVFSLEVLVYPVFIMLAMYIFLFAKDLLPVFPMFIFGYISPSGGNNPGKNGESIFSLTGGGRLWGVLLIMMAACLVYRLVFDPVFGGKKFIRKQRKLLPGMLLLGASYAISGIFSGQWQEHGWQNLVFALLQFFAIAGIYYLISGAVLWEDVPDTYLFWVGLCVGYVLLAELVGMYLFTEVIVDGVIFRERIVTGWGHYNNIGALFVMIIPLCFYLTSKKRFANFVYISTFLFCLGIIFTCSRNSILFGLIVYVVSYAFSVYHNKHSRLFFRVHLLLNGGPVLAFLLFKGWFMRLFADLFDAGLNSSFVRIRAYWEGFKQFLRYPIFGGSFFPTVDIYEWSSSEAFTSMFPARWHNTFIQIIATGGLVCLAAYVLHRMQTINLFLKDASRGKLFAGLSVLVLLLMSHMDCHFFNIGPVFLYSGILAFVEFGMCEPNRLDAHRQEKSL